MPMKWCRTNGRSLSVGRRRGLSCAARRPPALAHRTEGFLPRPARSADRAGTGADDRDARGAARLDCRRNPRRIQQSFVPANDEDSQQLLRQLSAAGLLDQVDLIALLLRRADEERIANAIRARSNPRGGYLQALIADEDEMVSASAMAVILARGRRRNRLGQPMIAATNLRPSPRSTASATSGFLLMTASIGCGAIFLPPDVTSRSFLRSVIRR